MRLGTLKRRVFTIYSPFYDNRLKQYGLIGSTEFVEDFAASIKKRISAYFNTDIAAEGSIVAIGASPSLSDLYLSIAGKVAAPDEPGKTLADYFTREHAIGPLGSGSDYTPFLQHLGENDTRLLYQFILEFGTGIASGDIGLRKGRSDPV